MLFIYFELYNQFRNIFNSPYILNSYWIAFDNMSLITRNSIKFQSVVHFLY